MEKKMRAPHWTVVLLLFASTGAWAAGTGGGKGGGVLDFEADVIEGEKRRPDLFIQMEGGNESLDSVLYSREDFNDFHEQDRKWRPKARKVKGQK